MNLRVYIKSNPNFTGQLGQAASTRRVTITGTATFQPSNLGKTIAGIKQDLKGILGQGDGWVIYDLDISDAGYFLAGKVGISITADVPDAYPNAAHRDEATRVFNDYRISLPFGGGLIGAAATNAPFSNVKLSITGEEKSGYVPPQTTTIKATPTPGTKSGGNPDSGIPSGATIEEIAAYFKDKAADATDLFGIAGLSVGTVGIILVAIVLLKNR